MSALLALGAVLLALMLALVAIAARLRIPRGNHRQVACWWLGVAVGLALGLVPGLCLLMAGRAARREVEATKDAALALAAACEFCGQPGRHDICQRRLGAA